jgi:hypothetical protein
MISRGSGNVFLAVREAAGGSEKTGMGDHAVLRARAHAFEMPKAHQSPMVSMRETFVIAQGVDRF